MANLLLIEAQHRQARPVLEKAGELALKSGHSGEFTCRGGIGEKRR